MKYNYEVSVNENRAKLNKDIFLFRGNRNIHYYFSIKGARFAFKKEGDLIENANAIYAAVTVIKPNGVEVANAIAPVENGLIHLKVTEDLIDEEVEVGDFDLVFDLFDDTDGAVTIPKVIGQFHVLERPCTTPISELAVATNTTNEVDYALTDYAITTYAEPVASTNEDGTFAKKTWVPKEKITTAELNRIEEGISYVSSQFKDIANYSLAIGTDGLLYIKKQDGTLIGTGVKVSGDVDLSKVTMSIDGQTLKLLNNGEQITTVDIPTGEVPNNIVLFEETTETPANQESSIPINSPNGTTYYIKVDDEGSLSVENTNGEIVWNGGGGQEIVPATNITLNKTAETVMVGNTFELTTTIEPVDCTQTVKWYTNNATIATVENGIVTGRGIGDCTITAKVGKCTATCNVKVEKFTLLIWNSGSVNEEITGGWDYTNNKSAGYGYLDENGNYVLANKGNWSVKHFVTKNAIDLSKYNKLILSLEVRGSGELQCQTSDDGASVTSTYKYLSVNSDTSEYEVDISEVTNTTRLSFNNYSAGITIKKIGLE